MLEYQYIQDKSRHMKLVENLYLRAFPKDGRLPFPYLLWKAKGRHCDLLAFYEDRQFAGFACIFTWRDISFIPYFSVEKSFRDQGLGGKLLTFLRSKYPGRLIMFAETIDPNAVNLMQREDRVRFYEEHGFTDQGYSGRKGSIRYQIYCAGGNVSRKEYHQFMCATFGIIPYTIHHCIHP